MACPCTTPLRHHGALVHSLKVFACLLLAVLAAAAHSSTKTRRAATDEGLRPAMALCAPQASLLEMREHVTPAQLKAVCIYLATLEAQSCTVRCTASYTGRGTIAAYLTGDHLSRIATAPATHFIRPLLSRITPPSQPGAHRRGGLLLAVRRLLFTPTIGPPTPPLTFTFNPGNYQITEGVHRQPSWALDRLDQGPLPLDGAFVYPNSAPSVSIYVLDTGVRASHVEFQTLAPPASTPSRVTDVYKGAGMEEASTELQDCSGHGTHVASLAAGLSAGVAKRAQVKAMRVLSCKGTSTPATVVQAIDWLIEHATKPAVAVLAMGEVAKLPVVDHAIRRCAPIAPLFLRVVCHPHGLTAGRQLLPVQCNAGNVKDSKILDCTSSEALLCC
jgi:hypothetical protein